MFDTPTATYPTRVNLDDLFEKIGTELQDINPNVKHTHVVKLGDKFIEKNSPELIKVGKPRYVISPKPFRFYKESEAHDAARCLGGKVVRE
jgi:hypothetical protein